MDALTISKKLFFLFLVIILSISSCKKDRKSGNLPKLKSLSFNNGGTNQEKVEFSYDKDGNLETSRQYVNQIPEHYFSYKYANGVLTQILHYEGAAAVEANLVATISPDYINRKLSKIFIQPVNRQSDLPATDYQFDNGSLHTYSYFNDHIDFKDLYSEYRDRWMVPGGAGAPGNSNMPVLEYKYDGNPNPLYGLLWIHPVRLSGSLTYNYEFDAQAYFDQNNKIKQVLTYQGSPVSWNSISYQYTANGLPEKGVSTFSVGNYKYEITYEYW